MDSKDLDLDVIAAINIAIPVYEKKTWAEKIRHCRLRQIERENSAMLKIMERIAKQKAWIKRRAKSDQIDLEVMRTERGIIGWY